MTTVQGQLLTEFDIAAENFEYKIKNIEVLIKRFNNLADMKGNPINQSADRESAEFRDERTKALVTLFDYNYLKECEVPEQEVIRKFAREVVENDDQLDFYGDNWFAEIRYKTQYKGNEEELVMVLFNYSPREKVSGWTISSFDFEPADLRFYAEGPNIILPPNSDGTMFINLKQVLNSRQETEAFTKEDNELGSLLTIIQSNELKLEHITKIQFHFWQIKPYHIMVDYFNRNEMNSGWLITSLEEGE